MMLSKDKIKQLARKAGIKVTFDPNKTDFVDENGNNFANYDFSAFPLHSSDENDNNEIFSAKTSSINDAYNESNYYTMNSGNYDEYLHKFVKSNSDSRKFNGKIISSNTNPKKLGETSDSGLLRNMEIAS